MEKHGRLWNDLNTLLAYLRDSAGGFDVARLVDEHFARFGNDAPGQLLREQIEKVQKHLDEAR